MRKIWLILLIVLAQIGADAATHLVRMTRFNTFDPRDITINVGDTIIWTNISSVGHDAVAFDNAFKSPLLSRNQSWPFTFTSAGNHDYFCTPHLGIGMIGSVTVQGAANTPPTAAITSPANNSTFQASETINVAVDATDDSGVARVELLVDGVVTQTDSVAPYQFAITLTAGAHILTARAVDAEGLTGTSPPITVNITAQNQPPTVSIAAPANNSTFTAPADLVIEATASDDNGVDRVEFFVNGASIGADNTSPYSMPRTFTAGTYTLVATAFDAAGLSANSTEVTIQVNEPLPSAPAIAIVTPLQDSYVEFAPSITLAALATDADGTIAQVEFNESANSLGAAVATAIPNRFELATSLPEGRITITARATDNQGIATVSDPVAFTVAMTPILTTNVMLTNGVMRVGVFGTSKVPFVFEYSEDMITWVPFKTNILYRRILFFDDETVVGRPNRIYRARSPDAAIPPRVPRQGTGSSTGPGVIQPPVPLP